jgi:putative membrane protein
MRHHLTEDERLRLDRLVAEAEHRTGAQFVLGVIDRSDSYAELPWKAFALGASAAGLAVFLLALFRAGWTSFSGASLAAAAVLGAGVLCSLLSVMLPGVARLFLDSHRAEVETRQYAESLFLSRELFATRGRTGLLLLVSIFERQIVALPDRGLQGRLGKDRLQGAIAVMTPHLASGRVATALEQGLTFLEGALASTAPSAPGANELPDGVIEEKGQ